MNPSSLNTLSRELGLSLLQIKRGISSRRAIRGLVNALGWDLPPGGSDLDLSSLQVNTLADKLKAVLQAEIRASGSAGGGGVDLNLTVQYTELFAAVLQILTDIRNVANGMASLPPAYLAATNIQNEFFPRLLNFLIIQYIEDRYYSLFTVLVLFGIIEIKYFNADSSRFQVEHQRYSLRLERISTVLLRPGSVATDVYGWGTPGFSLENLLAALSQLFQALGGQLNFRVLPPQGEERMVGRAVPEATTNPMPQIFFSLVKGLAFDPLNVGLVLHGLRPSSPGANDGGLALSPFVQGSDKLLFQLSPTIDFELDASVDIQGGVVLSIRPNRPVSIQTQMIGRGPTGMVNAGRVALRFRYRREDNQPFPIVVIPSGSRLEFQQFYVSTGAGMVASNKFDLFVEVGLLQGRFVLDTTQGDGFLAKILPKDGIKADFDVVAGWSASQGVYFQGSSALEVRLPVHVDVGGISVKNLYLAIPVGGGSKIPLELSSTISANLGPLSATVDRLGFTANFDFPSNSNGNLGPLNVALGFKPPNGVGLSIDAGVVKGGGFLYFDSNRQEYAGALELVFSEFLNLKAIGLITTKMPDGSKGFSLLIIITADFGTGIQLGFGFTLIAVGGLLGLNRTMRLQPLAEGVRTGAINSILFPKDVIANAPRIISDLRTIFPPEEGKFLIGPMAKLGWGTPTLVSLSLGIIIEIPGNIAILGVLRVALPADELALIVLQVNFIGAIEFDKKRIWFFASLFESRVLFITLEGEIGLLVAFGDDANFVVSVGGFHPRYNPPPLPFPNPARLAINILNESFARIRVMGYFGITSNSVQFGAHAELFFGLDALSVEGHIGFDALLQFSPFFFIIEISASVSVKVFGAGLFGISLRFSLEGPTPWRARGTGSITILFFEISAGFDISWGEERNTTLPPIEVMPILKVEFEKLENWRALLPAFNNLLVSLRKLDSASDTLVLHPVGTLKISQKAIPLDLPIDKVGSQKPSDAKRFSATISSGGLDKKADTDEQFAIAQFQNMEDASKLSRPAYEPQHGGLELSVQGQQLASSRMVKRVIRYEEIIIDSNFKRFVFRFFGFISSLFNHFLVGGSISKSTLSKHYQQQLQPFDEKIAVRPDTYVVAFQSTNKAVSTKATFVSQATARDYMQQEISQDPGLSDSLHVIPIHEVAV